MDGTVIAESLEVGTNLDRLGIIVRRFHRYEVHDVPSWQPSIWTSLDFEADDDEAERLADVFAAGLRESGWYVNYSTQRETFVVFPGKAFRYERGDMRGRAQAQDHGRTLGIPEPQLNLDGIAPSAQAISC